MAEGATETRHSAGKPRRRVQTPASITNPAWSCTRPRGAKRASSSRLSLATSAASALSPGGQTADFAVPRLLAPFAPLSLSWSGAQRDQESRPRRVDRRPDAAAGQRTARRVLRQRARVRLLAPVRSARAPVRHYLQMLRGLAEARQDVTLRRFEMQLLREVGYEVSARSSARMASRSTRWRTIVPAGGRRPPVWRRLSATRKGVFGIRRHAAGDGTRGIRRCARRFRSERRCCAS